MATSPAEPVFGRLVDRGLHDELKGAAYAIIEGVDGHTHHLVFSDLEMTSDAKPGAIVESRAYDDAGGRKRLSLATRSDLAIEAQISAAGATWIDRQLLAKESALSSGGFGARSARRWIVGSIISSNRIWLGGKVNGSSSLAISSTRCAGASSMRPPPTVGRHRARPSSLRRRRARWGIYRQRVTLASGRFAMIDAGLSFQLVPWRPALEQSLGQQVSGTLTPGGGIDWSFQRRRGLSL